MNLKIASLYLVLVGCSGQTMKNPSATLRETGRPPSAHLQAMEMLDSQLGLDNPKYLETLHRMLWVPGYTNDAREGALSRLWRADRQGVIKTVRQRLPRMNNWPWIETLCEWITENVVVELDLALISSWSQPTNRYANEQDRPERKALVALYTEEALPDLVFNSLLATSKSWQQGYRTRCWE
ncbi:MAG: hypothetical protein QGF07_04760, partial [Phycisphaerales bacterium]|nr:hypothetical protein [Phycisphaerales bacterium]